MSSTPTNLILSLSTGSMLVGLWCGRAIARTIETLGEASETIFRGDRLPVLDFPDQAHDPLTADSQTASPHGNAEA
ncbi:MAG: hypothetical protein EAZ61_00585 [Oscillatoriales cyanobacterium]|jgi:hypothetical protein|nr:MAG: hypothetical protein EAZ61_00585 [Oscillatoriales cyanobacterium]